MLSITDKRDVHLRALVSACHGVLLTHLQPETRFGDKITWNLYREGFGGSKGVVGRGLGALKEPPNPVLESPNPSLY